MHPPTPPLLCFKIISDTPSIQYAIIPKAPMFIYVLDREMSKYFLTYTNPSHDQDARQWGRTLLLFLLFGLFVFYNHCTTQKTYHNHHHHIQTDHTIHLPIDVLQTSQGQIAITLGISQLP